MNYTTIRKLRTLINTPKLILIKMLYFLSPLLRDKLYLKLLFPLRVGYRLDLENPQSYNEKLQWLKLYYRNDFLTKLVNKCTVKDYVRSIIGDEYVIKDFGVWNSFDEINFDSLPSAFVLKTTHDSGGVVICPDKSTLDLLKTRHKLNKHLKKNHFYRTREWPYKHVSPQIIAEEFLVDESGNELKDYKFFCFNGEPKALFIATQRQTGDVKFDFFDINFNHLDIIQLHKKSGKIFEKPKNYDLMIKLAAKLAKGFPHVRIDFYNIDGKILFGEYTFFHHDGLVSFYPKKWDYEFGKYLQLPEKKLFLK